MAASYRVQLVCRHMDHQQWVTRDNLDLTLTEVLNTYWHFHCPLHGQQYEKPLQAQEKIGSILGTAKCDVLDCSNKAVGALGSLAFCRSHFTVACQTELDIYNQGLSEHRWEEVSLKSLGELVFACVEGEQRIERTGNGLDDVQRAQFLKIISAATSTATYLRRSPRRQLAIPVQLQFTIQAGSWEEVTETIVVSRCGALVRSLHSAERQEKFRVIQLAPAREAEARVVWCAGKENPGSSFAFEFLTCTNFWGLDWTATQTDV